MRWDSSDRGKRLAHMGSRKALKRKIDPERRRLAAGTAAWMLRVPHSSPLADPFQQLPGPLAFDGRLLLDLSVQMRESCLERGLRADVHPGAVGCCRTLHVQIQLDEDRTRGQNDPSAGMAAHSPSAFWTRLMNSSAVILSMCSSSSALVLPESFRVGKPK